MRIIDLSGMTAPQLNVRHIIDHSPAPRIKPDEEALRHLHSKSRPNKRQSETSRKRQNFISGVNRINAAEVQARRAYLEEWHDRMGHEQWSAHEHPGGRFD